METWAELRRGSVFWVRIELLVGIRAGIVAVDTAREEVGLGVWEELEKACEDKREGRRRKGLVRAG